MIPEPLASWPVVYHGVRFEVCAGLAPGTQRRREYVLHPGAVAILPVLGDGSVVLIRNERLAAGEMLWEIPAGTLEAGEAPAACAARELVEETGYRAARIQPLTKFYTSPGLGNELMHCYVATDLTPVGQALDEGERITIHPTPWEKTMEMVRTGQVLDGKTIACLMYYAAFVREANPDARPSGRS